MANNVSPATERAWVRANRWNGVTGCGGRALSVSRLPVLVLPPRAAVFTTA